MKLVVFAGCAACLVAQTSAFTVAPTSAFSSRAAVTSRMDAQMLFGLGNKAAEAPAGLVELTFNDKKKVSVAAGSKLSDAAAKAGVRVRYDCKEGKCGICAVKMNGKQVRTCITKVPKGGPLSIVVP